MNRASVPAVLIESRDDPKRPPSGQPKGARNRWHSVGIVSTGAACAAARACKDKRFLSTEAPRLPLAECDAAACKCKYRHFEDRRAGDRRSDDPMPTRKMPTTNRRMKKGRRTED